MGRDYFPCYYSYLEKTAMLSDNELGRLFRALMRYGATGEPQQLSGRESMAYDFIRFDIDRANENYQSVSEARSRAGKVGRQKQLNNGQNRANRAKPSKPGKAGQNGQTGQMPNLLGKTGYNKDEYENEDKDKNKDEDEDIEAIASCSELPASRASEPPSASPVIQILLNTGELYPVTQADVDSWAKLYPAVDIVAELRKMAGWCEANPQKRKTKAGVKRFMNGWLSRTQDRGGTNGYTGKPDSGSAEPQRPDWHFSDPLAGL